MNKKLPATLALLASATLAGACTDLKPLEAQVAELRSSIEKLNADNANMKQSIDSATQAASSVRSTASPNPSAIS